MKSEFHERRIGKPYSKQYIVRFLGVNNLFHEAGKILQLITGCGS